MLRPFCSLLGISAVFLTFLLVEGCSIENTRLAHNLPERGFFLKEQQADTTPLLYAVYVPRSYDPKKPWPCILFLHGAGESGTDGLKQVIQGLGSLSQFNWRIRYILYSIAKEEHTE